MADEKQLAPSEDYALTSDTVRGLNAMTALATKLVGATFLPESIRNNVGDIFILLDMRQRLNQSLLGVAQSIYMVHGNPSFSSKFLISCFNTCGRYSSIKYEYFGTPGTDEWGCRAYAKELASGEVVVGPDVTIAMAKAEGWAGKNGSKWKTMPQLMLAYRAAAFMIRTTAPEISLGMMTTEELQDTVDTELVGPKTFREQQQSLVEEVAQIAATPVEAPAVAVEVKQEAAEVPTAQTVQEAAPKAPTRPGPSWRV